jgi:hypothetical protein
MCTGFSDTVEPPFPASVVKSEPGPPMTLGNAAKAGLGVIGLRLVSICIPVLGANDVAVLVSPGDDLSHAKHVCCLDFQGDKESA